MSEILHGIVKWFNDAKGFGFIEHESGQDVFVHYSVIESEGFKTLKDGEKVQYELRAGDKGLNASRVIRSKEAELRDKEVRDGANQPPIAAQIEVSQVAAHDNSSSPGFGAASGERSTSSKMSSNIDPLASVDNEPLDI